LEEENKIVVQKNSGSSHHLSLFSRINSGEDEEEEFTIREFRQLTEYNNTRHEGITEFVASIKRLEELGIFK
jgi:hypothetical protein